MSALPFRFTFAIEVVAVCPIAVVSSFAFDANVASVLPIWARRNGLLYIYIYACMCAFCETVRIDQSKRCLRMCVCACVFMCVRGAHVFYVTFRHRCSVSLAVCFPFPCCLIAPRRTFYFNPETGAKTWVNPDAMVQCGFYMKLEAMDRLRDKEYAQQLLSAAGDQTITAFILCSCVCLHVYVTVCMWCTGVIGIVFRGGCGDILQCTRSRTFVCVEKRWHLSVLCVHSLPLLRNLPILVVVSRLTVVVVALIA